MSTIKITENVRDSLKEYGEGASIDISLNKLLDASDKPQRTKTKSAKATTNVRISSESLARLKEYKLCESETHTETILRLLNELSD